MFANISVYIIEQLIYSEKGTTDVWCGQYYGVDSYRIIIAFGGDMFDSTILGGTVYDGTLDSGRICDVGIKDGKISVIGDLKDNPTKQAVNANGYIVTPGFIDIHSHSDFSVLVDQNAKSKITQGVTTEVIGNCGMSAAPLIDECKSHIEDLYQEYGIDFNWSSLNEYRARCEEKGIIHNLVPLIGQGNIRASVIGYSDRSPTSEEILRMKTLLKNGMDEGGFGLSTGLIYPPGMYASSKELTQLASVLSQYDGIYTSHMRSEGDNLIEAIKEAIQVGEKNGLRVQISHLKTNGVQNWHKLEEAFTVIEDARKRGVDVSADRYPYTASCTDLDTILPKRFYAGGKDAELKRLRDKKESALLENELSSAGNEYWKKVMVSYVGSQKNKCYQGLFLSDIAIKRNTSPVTALVDLLVEEELKASGIFFSMSENNLPIILKKPYVMIASDASSRKTSGVLSKGSPHPRAYGTFPKIFHEYVGNNTLSFEEAVHKMTLMPAAKMGLTGRGEIKEGAHADIVIIDPASIKDNATYENPHQYSEGITMVIVSGDIVFDNGHFTGKLPGKVLSKNKQ
ncbi:MAG: D-aminoacylase [Candidatus Ancaeobacter aquaticus]|nr:D-aminoacylase [Candidatus Ancaeobacter aquaticus]